MKILSMFLQRKIIIGLCLVGVAGGVTTYVILNNDTKKEPEKIVEKKETLEKLELIDNLNIEINSETLLSTLVKDDKITIIDDINIETSKLGAQDIEIKYQKKEKEYSEIVKINIVDTIAPVIDCSKELKTTVGKEINLLKGVKVTDNSKEEIVAKVTGEYDFSKVGEYKLKYTAIDSSNNATEYDFVLIVKKKTVVQKKPATPNTNDVVKVIEEIPVEEIQEPVINEEQSIDSLITEKDPLYKFDYSFLSVSKTTETIAKDEKTFINIIYTLMSKGARKFHVTCKYEGCYNDATNIPFKVQYFVHPYYSIQTLSIRKREFSSSEVFLEYKIDRKLGQSEIDKLENKMSGIINSMSGTSTREKVEFLHDYLVRNISYDEDAALSDVPITAHNAYGAVINGRAVCEGYAQAYQLLLNKINIPNYIISNDFHAWNIAKIDGTWLHIDVTHDDPIIIGRDSESSLPEETEHIEHTYFLKTTSEIKDNNENHDFDSDFYLEV